MTDELYSRFDEALRAESSLAADADHDGAAVAAVGAVRARRRHRAAAAAAVALVAVPALAFGAYALVGVDAVEPMVSPSPSPTAVHVPTPSPTASPSQVTPSPEGSNEAAPATWDEVAEADRPPFLTGLHAGLPRARAMEEWVWEYVDDGWTLQTHQVGEPMSDLESQSLYLTAPDGEMMHLYSLRLDYGIYVGHWDADRRLAWLERHEGGDGFEVVQMDLRDGSLTSDWDAGAAPTRQVTGDGVTSVRRVGDTPDGTEVWVTVSYFAPPYPVMLRDEDGEFAASAGSAWLERQWSEGWGDRDGDQLAESWVADDLSVAVYEVLDVEWSETDERVRGDSRWVVHDLGENTVMEVTPRLPSGQACWAPPRTER